MNRVLCVCQYGHSRSVALARRLHHRKIVAVAAGWSTGGDALAVLSAWADVIAVMTPEIVNTHIPAEHRHKVADFNVGPDRWSNPYNHELLAICDKKIEEFLARGSTAILPPPMLRLPVPCGREALR